MTDEALIALGRLLTGNEASKLAARFEDGDTLHQALQGIPVPRQAEVRAALEASGVVPDRAEFATAVLRAIQGAGSLTTDMTPVWTLPGYLADYGALTGSIRDLILSARVSVTCSTFNFQKSSSLWEALRDIASRGTVEVRVYLDSKAAEIQSWPGSPTSREVAAQLVGARVFQTRRVNGKPVRNHAKFVAVDHQFLIVTSANFSRSAEERNVELGLRVESRNLTEMVERQMSETESTLYLPVASR